MKDDMHEHQKNVFDFTRLVAAILVIIGHSRFVLGSDSPDYLGLIMGVKAISN